MKKILSTLLLLSGLNAGEIAQTQTRVDSVRKSIDKFGTIEDKEVGEVDKIRQMFRDGKNSGQIRVIYAGAPEPGDAYVSAIGGILKYELAEYRGFNAGAAMYTAYELPFASGSGAEFNSEVTSSQGNHTDMNEAYLNYRYEDFSLRVGRQVLDTPLADADDIRIIKNSFEAYVAKYENEDLTIMLGNIQKWHGTDAGLDNGWVDTGDKGTYFAGISYNSGFELDAWYYDISGSNRSAYFDIGVEYHLNDEILLHMMAQYLNQSELKSSGIASSIIGSLVEIVVYDIGFNLAVNQSYKQAGKESFTGFGGGALFTNLDTMGIDAITKDRDAQAVVAGIAYDYEDFRCVYAYGDFSGDADSSGQKEHIVEQDIGGSYNFNDEFVVGLLYALYKDKENSNSNWNRGQVVLNYNF